MRIAITVGLRFSHLIMKTSHRRSRGFHEDRSPSRIRYSLSPIKPPIPRSHRIGGGAGDLHDVTSILNLVVGSISGCTSAPRISASTVSKAQVASPMNRGPVVRLALG